MQKTAFIPRVLSSYERPSVLGRGVRLGDRINIRPFQGRKRVVDLKRKKVFIYPESKLSQIHEDDYSYKVFLPSLNNQNLSFVLELCSDMQTHSEDQSRFLMKSLGETPFKINGSYSFESFLERGDRVDIGYNSLYFEKETTQKSCADIIYSDVQEFLSNEKMINSDFSLLLVGETGSGKSKLAERIHQMSGRLGKFVHVNLSSFSSSLLESEIFGHVRGAFTGALNDKKGAILEAKDGTLFLDEIDSVPLEIQTKLLLFLDDKLVRPVGGSSSFPSNVRLIFASGRPLPSLVDKKIMRKDFYYRLCSGPVLSLSPLRDNPEKIKELCLFLEQEEDVLISQDLISFYQTLPWPGNLRQLIGHIKKKKVLTKGRKLSFDRYDEELLIQSSDLLNLDCEKGLCTMDELKLSYACKVFQHCDGNVGVAADILDITDNTLRSMIRKKGLVTQLHLKSS